MRERAGDLGNRVIALLVLIVAVWFLLKFVIGLITGIATAIAIVIAIGAVFWAVNRL
ncbi:hypothetical protein NBH00_16480 [Paraconexibacter antarcticus]|uniref:Uncharacterized protein n=1 Tax=Paraconexibacter antarcticus TaxID=2949664 RepID=A0ABY5DQV5_9ACTN|nr:hypothetical protein [Paraconexibacter antarcticus]UTI62949.1 hypothetical protein NBH00_16480 [Paraconexibacter antarcticus]